MLHGRRRGPRLRPQRRALLESALPKLRIHLPESGAIADPWAAFNFAADAPLWLEIGFGGGEHLAWQAEHHPHAAILGAEAFVNGIAAALSHIRGAGLTNIRIFPDDARPLVAALPSACLARVLILFPDPWPKTRHHKRRLLSAAFLDELARVMAAGAELRLATDHRGYCRWILARLLAHPAFAWHTPTPADWRHRPPDWPETRYERKATNAGRACTYLRFQRR